MKYVGFLLHAYQPSWQFGAVLKRTVDECYNPIFSFILEEANAYFTVNINYALLELLEKNNYEQVLNNIKKCAVQGKIKLTGSGAYHPILPLISSEETRRQIILNERGTEKILRIFLKDGFFPPELAFEKKNAGVIQKAGYRWTMAEDLPFILRHGYAPFDFIPSVEGLPVFLRSSLWSKKIALGRKSNNSRFKGREIADWLSSDLDKWFFGKDGYLIIAMDIETFGHHIREYKSFLKDFTRQIAKKDKIRLVFISELLQFFPTREIEVPRGSWSTEVNDIQQNNPYPLWKDKFNNAHGLLWQLVDLALSSLNTKNPQTRKLMDQGLNSCQFWWLARGNWNPVIAFQTIPILVKIISSDRPENLGKARRIISDLEKATQTQISISGNPASGDLLFFGNYSTSQNPIPLIKNN